MNDLHKPENNPVKRFWQNEKIGWRPAINAMCAFCVGCTAELQGKGFKDHIEPGFRGSIRQCAVLACPIHHLRPYQDASEEQEAPEPKEQRSYLLREYSLNEETRWLTNFTSSSAQGLLVAGPPRTHATRLARSGSESNRKATKPHARQR